MKILFVHNSGDLYGASRSLLRMTSRLRSEGHDIVVVLPCNGPLQLRLEQHRITTRIYPDLPVVTRPTVRGAKSFGSWLWSIPASLLFFLRLAEEFRPDILHTNTAVILTPALISKVLRIPHVWHIRESFCDYPILWRLYQWYLYALADQIICVSYAVAEQFHAHIRRAKVQVLYNGIPAQEFVRPDPERIEAYRQRHGLVGKFVVGVVGRIKYQRKGQDVAVLSAQQLCPKYPELLFLFVGTPFPGNESHLENLRDLIAKHQLEDRVLFSGDSDDICIAYSALDISLIPSAFPEPFGNVVAESMAMKKAVIGSRIGGIAEQIEDGVSGLLVEPNDPSSLAGAVERLMTNDDLRSRLAENGRARFLEQFEFEKFYAKLLVVYDALVQQKPAHAFAAAD